jgi:hypothetical protein
MSVIITVPNKVFNVLEPKFIKTRLDQVGPSFIGNLKAPFLKDTAVLYSNVYMRLK